MTHWRSCDWHLHEIVPALAFTVPVITAVCFAASAITNLQADTSQHISLTGTLVLASFFCTYIILVLGWGHFGEWRTGWRLFCGTTVLCKQELLHQWHGNTDTDPVWVYLRSTFKPWHYHNPPHSRQVTFLYRKHALLFKLAWG